MCVTGATGYVASVLIDRLLADGRFEVVGTIRSLRDVPRVQMLRAAFPRLVLCEADLLFEGSFRDAFVGCQVVFHTASPFELAVEDAERDLTDPAIRGTENVIRQALTEPCMRRIILTSSFIAVYSPKPAGHVFTDRDWNQGMARRFWMWCLLTVMSLHLMGDSVDNGRSTMYSKQTPSPSHLVRMGPANCGQSRRRGG